MAPRNNAIIQLIKFEVGSFRYICDDYRNNKIMGKVRPFNFNIIIILVSLYILRACGLYKQSLVPTNFTSLVLLLHVSATKRSCLQEVTVFENICSVVRNMTLWMVKNHIYFRLSTTNLCCVLEWNKCGLFSNKHNGMASIQIAVISQHYSNNPYKNLQRKILNCNCNIYFNNV
jgi:hypothetical protein